MTPDEVKDLDREEGRELDLTLIEEEELEEPIGVGKDDVDEP